MLSSIGLAASVEATVKERERKVIYELSQAIVEDFRMQAEAVIDLYVSCIVPSLL